MPGKKNVGDRRERLDDTVISVASELFLKNGIEQVKMTDIADAAGIGVASLYRHFKTKEHIALLSGVFLWRDLRTLFRGDLEGEAFDRLNGMEKIERMLGVYRRLYTDHSDFLKFLSAFDDLVLRKGIPYKDLCEYEDSVLDFYPLFLRAYNDGIADRTVRPIEDPKLFYDTVCHAAVALSQKLLRGMILSADAFSAPREIDSLLAVAADYLRNKR